MATQRIVRAQYERAAWLALAALVMLVPAAVLPAARDMFRLPKEALFNGGILIIGGLFLLAWLAGEWTPPAKRTASVAIRITGGAIAWTLIAALFSSNGFLSFRAFALACGYAVFYIVAESSLARRRLSALVLLFIPAAANALVVISQEGRLWHPFELQDFSYDPHLASTGLMGNPNGVGTLLMGCTLASFVLVLITRSRARLGAISIAILLGAGLLASQTLTAIAALAAGLAAVGLLLSWRRAAAVLVFLAIATATVTVTYAPMRERLERLSALARERQYNALLTNRLTPFVAATEMVRSRPLTGVGPGTFGWHYFDEKVAAEKKYPWLATSDESMHWTYSFSEAHNDHLEVLAETGVPGYLIFLAALFSLGAVSWKLRKYDGEDLQRCFAKLMSLPLAISFGVLTLAQFPLQITGAFVPYLFLSAACFAWGSDPDEHPPAPARRRFDPRWAAGLLALLILPCVWFVAVLPLRSSIELKRLEGATESALARPQFLAAPMARDNVAEADRLLKLDPRQLPLLMVRAANLKILDRNDEAAATYQRALNVEKRPEIFFQLGSALFAEGRTDESVAAFVAACRFQPMLLERVPLPLRAEVEKAVR